MKHFSLHVIPAFTIIISFVAHQVYGYAVDYQSIDDEAFDEGFLGKQLSPQEEVLANEARAQIAKVIENNLVRVFAVITAQNEENRLYVRQDDDEDEIVTPNPNVLPQVAQILGAIFSGNLNITRIVDGTVGLVPNLVRNQIQGLVKLLTGENVNLTGETTTAIPAVIIEQIAQQAQQQQNLQLQQQQQQQQQAVAQVVQEATTVSPLIVSTSTDKGRYRVRNRTRHVSSTASPVSLGDDEIERYARDLRAAAKLYEPYVQNKDPRFYAGAFESILKNVNMTQVAQAVPSIFKGANQAFTMLDNLGVIDSLPGVDVAEDLDIAEEEE